jgi:hypothetical protein
VVLFDKTKSSNTLPIVYYNCYNDDCHIVGLMNTSFNPVTKRRNPMVFEGPFVCTGGGGLGGMGGRVKPNTKSSYST